ncbi:hypothetical protein ACE1SV_03150 [Streptomyces sp. E-15]
MGLGAASDTHRAHLFRQVLDGQTPWEVRSDHEKDIGAPGDGRFPRTCLLSEALLS